MGLAKLKPRLSVEDYLTGETKDDLRHEYIYGEVYAMAGSSDRHNRICFNIAKKVDDKIDPSGVCQVFMTDMKLQADESTFYYPDVFVAYDNPDPYFRREPILVVEVLSPSTESTDRREKLRVYREIPSLREYVIVAQDEILIEFHQKQDDGTWKKEVFSAAEAVLKLESFDLNLSLEEIYRGVNFG